MTAIMKLVGAASRASGYLSACAEHGQAERALTAEQLKGMHGISVELQQAMDNVVAERQDGPPGDATLRAEIERLGAQVLDLTASREARDQMVRDEEREAIAAYFDVEQRAGIDQAVRAGNRVPDRPPEITRASIGAAPPAKLGRRVATADRPDLADQSAAAPPNTRRAPGAV